IASPRTSNRTKIGARKNEQLKSDQSIIVSRAGPDQSGNVLKGSTVLGKVRNKREYLARALGRLGLIGLLERITAFSRPSLLILTYHRIAEPGADPFYDPD